MNNVHDVENEAAPLLRRSACEGKRKVVKLNSLDENKVCAQDCVCVSLLMTVSLGLYVSFGNSASFCYVGYVVLSLDS